MFLLSGCVGGVDLGTFNLQGNSDPLGQVAPRPEADARGLITYPNYQLVEARRGDTVTIVATRLGISAQSLASHNGLKADSALRAGELLALPGRVGKASTTDIAAIASNAIATANNNTTITAPPVTPPVKTVDATAIEPIRHQVERGDTAYSIARLYSVSVTALAKWNRLGPDLAIRQGQQLLIPIIDQPAPAQTATSEPGAVSVTPIPPSAKKPLPPNVKKVAIPPSPNLAPLRTQTAPQKFLMPVSGDIISQYSGQTGGNDGIDISASAGTAVKAAADGEVALVSKSVAGNTIVLLRHADGIYTVYSNVSDVRLQKGQKVRRGQRLGGVADNAQTFLHFEVRRGTQSVDPMPFL